MLRLFVEILMNLRCCCEQGGAAYRTVLYPNHYSEAPGLNPSGAFEVCTWGSSTGSVTSGAVAGLGLSEAHSSRDMAATVPEKADICPKTIPSGRRLLVFPVWVTSTYHVWSAVQSMVPVATCTQCR